ncbi:nuclear transport factor 2 family protein [Halobaculum sp. D14]|uniref:nuclear transport factor 2 family protein n=1 Tax=Halobaculum sp. D14 TaxID=3421642 RepID=UPI003EBB2DAD
MTDDDRGAAVRTYYRAIDDGAYDDLASLLSADFVHRRPDRTLEGRDRFVRFMRDERPNPDTVHSVDAVYADADADSGERAARGRLFDAGGEELFAFVDVFRFDDADRLVELRTFTR